VTGFYGQISKIDVLTVTGDWILRANLRNRRFARNQGAAFYGHIPEIDVLPVNTRHAEQPGNEFPSELCILRHKKTSAV